ncbi:MAG: sugar ABC transporter ATP-binding protein [Candidatus Limnocylindrales bacterium]
MSNSPAPSLVPAAELAGATVSTAAGTGASPMAPALLVDNLSKTFPGQRALDRISLAVKSGEIHGLVGHNGSGKSTLIKILSGFHLPDPGGSVAVAGKSLLFGNPGASRLVGLRFVHQELGLVDSLTVAENIAIDVGFVVKAGRILWREERERARRLLEVLDSTVDPSALVADLGPAERTEVAIARALASADRPTKVIVLDEPTANLAGSETTRLFAILRRLKANGVAVVFVSHIVEEVLNLCDRVTVLREGRVVGTFDRELLTHDVLVNLIVGAELTHVNRQRADLSQEDQGAGARLEVQDLRGGGVDGISFSARSGQVVGIAGITGSGREDVAGLLFGSQDRSGQVAVEGASMPGGDPRKAIAAGMALLPSERVRRAIIPTMNVRENVTLPRLRTVMKSGRIDGRLEREDASLWLRRLGVRPDDPEAQVAALSGGNQQRMILAKCMRLQPAVLVLDEPTQGVDVGAKEGIYAMVAEAARGGAAVVLCSSDSEELAATCDRVLVMQRGRVTHVLEGEDIIDKVIDTLELGGSVEGIGR